SHPTGEAKHPQGPCTKPAQVPFVAARPCQPNRQLPSGLPSIAAHPVLNPRLPSVVIHIRAAIQVLLHLSYHVECLMKRHSIALVPECQSTNCQSSAQGA